MSAAEPLPPADERGRSWWLNPADVFLDELYVARATAYFEGLYERPWWHTLALCRGEMKDGQTIWFAGLNTPEGQHAVAICEGCPVREECAEAGVDQRGIWGGR